MSCEPSVPDNARLTLKLQLSSEVGSATRDAADINVLPLTVLIAAKNEACNIRECLRSVQWADQVCVIDSESTDETIEIATDEGAEVYQFHYEGGWPK
jgi:hypothetical protein